MNDTSPVRVETAQPHCHAPGLYFSLNESDYHADPALGSGSVRALAKCPIFYWQESWMNPLREPREETPALLFGRALHKLVLEGPDAFKASYVSEPCQADHPGALITATQISAALKGLGEKVSGSKAEVTERLRSCKPDAVFWDDVCSDFLAMCAKTRRTALKADVYNRVVAGAAYIAGDERVRVAFTGGRPEVSIFWEVDGVRLKARLDYVRLGREKDRRIAIITDLKSFGNVLDKPPEVAVMHAIANSRLDIQAASYLSGAALIPEFIADGKVFGGDGVNEEWLEALGQIYPDDWHFYWTFFQKDAPISLLRRVTPKSAVVQSARMELDRALAAYRDHMTTFGTNWRFVDPMPEISVEFEDLPKWLGMH